MTNVRSLVIPKGANGGSVDPGLVKIIDRYLDNMEQLGWRQVSCMHRWNREFNREETIVLLSEG